MAVSSDSIVTKERRGETEGWVGYIGATDELGLRIIILWGEAKRSGAWAFYQASLCMRMFVSMHVCVCMSMCVSIRPCVCVCICVCPCVCFHVCLCMYMFVCVYVCVFVCVYSWIHRGGLTLSKQINISNDCVICYHIAFQINLCHLTPLQYRGKKFPSPCTHQHWTL